MTVELWPVEKVIPYPKNARKITQAAIDKVAEIILLFGWQQPIVVDAENVILVGHVRRLAALKLGLTEVPVVVAGNLSPAQAKAYRLADNRSGEEAKWDEFLLAAELADLQAADASMFTGFDARDLARLTAGGAVEGEDDVPVVKVPVSKPGDLWILGPHRLLCGDCTKPEDVGRVRAGSEFADCMWTDPPYGVDYVGKTADAMTIQNDGADSSVVLGAMRMASSALRPSAPFYIAHPAGPRASVFARIVEEVGWRVHQQLVWVKDSMVLGHSDYHYQHEPILYGYTSGDGRPGRGNHVGSKWYGDNAQVSVLAVDRPKRNADHPTSKPVELVRRCIRNSTRLADVVYDPFLGSGTTLIACETEGRRCFGLEIEPKYVDVIVARWEKISGGEAILDGSDGLTFAKVRAGRLEQWQDEVMEEAVR